MVGRGKFKGKLAVQMGGSDFFQFGQRFDAALRLRGFGGFGFEAVDKGLQMFDVRLLLHIGSLLVGQPRGALFQVKIVVAAVAVQLAAGEFDGVVGGGVEKIAVVRNDDLGAGQRGQMAFQPQHGFQIQVVGGFVQQQQIGAAHQGLGEIEPHPPAAGKGFNRFAVFFLREAESAQQFGGAGGGGVGVDFFELGVYFGNTDAVVLRFGCGQGSLKSLQLGIALQNVVERADIERGRFLRHGGGFPMFGNAHFAAVGGNFAFD